MRLSRSGWNNVIIFAVMGFILMVNMTNKRIFDDEQSSDGADSAYIIGQEQVILTLMVDQVFTIERAGVHWQFMPKNIINAQIAEQMMRAWHSTKGQKIHVESAPSQTPVMISFMVAGQQNIQMLSLYPQDGMLLVRNHQTNEYLAVAPQLFQQLVPAALLN